MAALVGEAGAGAGLLLDILHGLVVEAGIIGVAAGDHAPLAVGRGRSGKTRERGKKAEGEPGEHSLAKHDPLP